MCKLIWGLTKKYRVEEILKLRTTFFYKELFVWTQGAVFYLSEDVNGTRILEEMNPNPSFKLSTFSLNQSIELDPEQGEYLLLRAGTWSGLYLIKEKMS